MRWNPPLLEALPGKVALIKKTYRPPNFETPTSYFNEAFHLQRRVLRPLSSRRHPAGRCGAWKLAVGGEAAQKSFELTLDQLKREFEAVEVAAVCQCSGNRRGLSDPHVVGRAMGLRRYGQRQVEGRAAQGCAGARGARRKKRSRSCSTAPMARSSTRRPDFVKSIPVWKALDDNTLLAWEMNGGPLPHWNGYPVRVVVPGWTATYWMKHVTSIQALSRPFTGFWMEKAYRIPKGKFPIVDRFISQETESNTPITEMVVNSLITNLHDGSALPAGKATVVRGIAWDGGYGIRQVDVSLDGGANWRPCRTRPRSRPLRMAPMDRSDSGAAAGQLHDHGEGHQSRGCESGFRFGVQPGRLSPQRGAAAEREGRLSARTAMRRLFLLSLMVAGAGAARTSLRSSSRTRPAGSWSRKTVSTCHSLDYIPMNSAFLDRKGWEASVTKMMKVMGAPIPNDEVPGIVDYLTRNYGKP